MHTNDVGDMNEYTKATALIDFNHPVVADFRSSLLLEGKSDKEKVLAIYFAVRDSIRYNPFDIRFEAEALKADRVLQKGHGHCVDKALLFVTLCRAEGIPARIGLAKVQNHMGTAKLEEKLGTNVLAPHGYAEVYLDGKWIKCTPAFNKELCERLGVEQLDFDAENDSIFQAYDRAGGTFMQYLEDYGTFADLPVDFIKEVMEKTYPNLFDAEGNFMLQ